MKLNESFTVGNYTFTYRGIRPVPCDFGDCTTIQGMVLVTSAADGSVVGGLFPYRDVYPDQQPQPLTSTIPDVTGSFNEEVYLIMASWENMGSSASFQVYINPLINWVWVGGIVVILGFFVAFWKMADEPLSVTARQPERQRTGVPAPAK